LGSEELIGAVLKTPFGFFEVNRTDKKLPLTQSFQTYLTQYDEFSQFIVKNCADNPPPEGVKQLLDKIQELRAQNIAT
jgi:hypothetical protein